MLTCIFERFCCASSYQHSILLKFPYKLGIFIKNVSHAGPHDQSIASDSKLGASENLFDGDGMPIDAECFEVCCWQGDPSCPYPYCNYNQGPCSGQ